MMIKLFLITLLCATLVFANSPVQEFQDVTRVKPMNGFVSNMADYFKDHGSSLVRRSAGYGTGSGGGGASGNFGFGMNAGAGGGMGGR